MVLRLSKYDGKYRVVSLAKDERTKEYLESKELPVLYLCDNEAIITPDAIRVTLSQEELSFFNECCNYDVFEINTNGTLYLCYSDKSIDNVILVTNKCNSNCIMCPTAETVRKGDEEYSANELISIARHFPDDAKHITITGGEPFIIKKGMFDLLAFLRDHFPCTEFLLLTNGRAFCSQEYVSLFQQTSPQNIKLGIPIHGHTSELHDYIAQVKGAYKQTFLGLKHLLSIGAKIELRIVVSQLNAKYITEIARVICSDFKSVDSVKIIGLEMTGNAAIHRDAVWIGYKEAFESSKNAINIMIKSGIDVGLYNFPLCSVKREYWNMCEKSISEHKIRYASECDFCSVKDACGGIFSGTLNLAKSDIRPIQIYD